MEPSVQQATPAAQRPGAGQMPDRLLHQGAQAGLVAVVGAFSVGQPILGPPVPVGHASAGGSWPAAVTPTAGRRGSWTPPRPGRCGCGAWRRTAPSGWPSDRGRCTRVASPSMHTASPVAAISASRSRRSARLVTNVPSGWQHPERGQVRPAAGPCCRRPRSWRSRPSGRRAGTTARPAATAPTASKRTSNASGGVPPRPGGRGGSRWASRPVSQASTSTGSDERGLYGKGTRPPGRRENLAYGLGPCLLAPEHHGHLHSPRRGEDGRATT